MSSVYDILPPKEFRRLDSDYCDKMMHKVPDAPVVDREAFVLAKCKGRAVLNLGSASGSLHQKIQEIAASVIGVDQSLPADVVFDLDGFDSDRLEDRFHGAVAPLSAELIVCGEILEHLGNPGNLLRALRSLSSPILITVPNAYSLAGPTWLKKGYEHVNPDHVAWYSYHTLKTLVERYGYKIKEFAWYNGKPLTAEGLIFIID